MLEDYLVYNGILMLCPLLAYVGVRYNVRAILIAAYLILGVFGIVRYDIGNDYENYYNMFEYLPVQFDFFGFSAAFLGLEPFALLLGMIFRHATDPQILCIGA